MTETVAPCGLCAREMAGTPDYGRLVCSACERGIHVDLGQILDAAAIATATPDVLASHGSGRRSKPGSRPPVSLGHIEPALTAIDEVPGDHSTETTVLALLESWARMWRNVTRLSRWGEVTEPAATGPAATLAVVVRDLQRQLPVMLADPRFPAADLADHVRRCLGALRALDPARDRDVTTWRVPCPTDVAEDGPGTEQGGPTADETGSGVHRDTPTDSDAPTARTVACGHRITVTPGDLHGSLWCRGCHTEWTAQRLLLVALSDPRVTIWGYGSDVADALGIPARTLRDWTAKGRLSTRGSRIDAGQAYRLRADNLRATARRA